MTPRLVDRLRTRLLAALGVLLLSALALALLGGIGMGSAQRALVGFQDEVLPNVTQALELAERTTKLAAIAPSVSESRSPEALALNREALFELLGEIRGRVATLPGESGLVPVLRQLLGNVDRDLTQLLELTRRRQASQQALQEQLGELDRIAGALPEGARSALFGQPRFASMWSDLVVGAGSDSAATLGRLEADVEALWISARRAGQVPPGSTSFLDSLAAVSQGPGNVLAVRREQLELERRTAYLVVLTRGNAEQLSDEVGRYVSQVRQRAEMRRAEVQAATRSRETGMLALALGCLLIAALATRYVRRFVRHIETVTSAMTRLAQGDTAAVPPTAPLDRRDELGALARSFEVFRQALLSKQVLVADLHAQSALLAAVHESMTDALAVFDRRGSLLLWNTRLADAAGRYGIVPRPGLGTRALLRGLPPQASWLVPGGAGRQRRARLDPARFAQVELHLPDGRIYDLRSRRMSDGGTVTLATDLTARRAIESQVQQAQRLELLGQLTGGVAHDFNNHLGTIIGSLGLVAAGADAPGGEAGAQLERARRAASSAAALTRRLLAFARSQPLEAEWVEVDAMIEEMRDLLEYSAGTQTLLELRLGARGAHLHVDRGQLENALLNLVLNSAAAMPASGSLTIATAARPQGPGAAPQVEIRVADTGSGIAEPLLGRVFEPFFTTKPAGQGSGLGLSGVYGFVKQSGGDVTLTSRLGQGTTIVLTLPRAEPPAPPAGAALLAPPLPASALAGLKVLVVDDDAPFRSTLGDMLQAAGATVHATAGAEAALRWLAGGAPCDLAVTDVCLGTGPDGLALAQALRRERPGLRVVLMSGLPFEPLMQRAEWDAGFGLLGKPFDAAALAAQLGPAVPLRPSAPAPA